ncbi:hypothetical protein EDM80_01750 [bacterium]|nr:MAG: hypothetical protein EDM80_01750 [bacterium]
MAASPHIVQQLARQQLIHDAVLKLYAARGGNLLDLNIRQAEETVQAALKCREADHRRLIADPDARREKGERPIVTVSEGRLHARDLARFMEQKQLALLEAKNLIEEAINRALPRSEEDLRLVLEAAVQDIAAVGRMGILEPPPPVESFTFEDAAHAAAQVMPQLPKKLAQALEAALLTGRVERVYDVLGGAGEAAQQEFAYHLKNALYQRTGRAA